MKKFMCLFLFLFLLLSIQACDIFGSDEDSGSSGTGIVRITDDINTPTTWTSNNVYVIEGFDLWVNKTLTIEAGTIIKFHPDKGPLMTIGDGGRIIADGTSSSPIVFTSYYDDGNGGDTNSDSSATAPASKNWCHIETNGTNDSLFDYCRFYYGGGGTYRFTLGISAGSDNVTVSNCIFAHNDGSGYSGNGRSGALDAGGGESGVVIRDNYFYDNIQPLYIRDTFDMDDSNVFHNPDNESQTNTRNGIFVYTTTVSGMLSWAETEVAYVIEDNDWWIGDGTPAGSGTLDLANNVVLKFKEEGTLCLSEGSSVNNWWGSGVAFTSYLDDSRKGDTNGDGSAISANSDDWEGIYDDGTPDWIVSLWPIYYDSHD